MRILVLILVCCIHFTAFSQDLIITKTGENIQKEDDVLPYIYKKMGSFYLDNGQVYDEEQFKQFLMEKKLNPIWMKYSSGKNLLIAGWAMIGGGTAFMIIGNVLTWNDLSQVFPIGVPLVVIGALAMYAGIPTAIVGAVRKNRAINDYNAMYARKPWTQNITITAGCVGNGVGLVLNF